MSFVKGYDDLEVDISIFEEIQTDDQKLMAFVNKIMVNIFTCFR